MTKCICGEPIIPLMLDCITCGISYETALKMQQELTEEDIELQNDKSRLIISISHDGTNFRRVIEKIASIEQLERYLGEIVDRINL